MQKKTQRSFYYVLTTVVIAIFGAFSRWLQMMNGYDVKTGLPITGSKITIFLIIYFIGAAITFAVMIRTNEKKLQIPRDAWDAFAVKGPLYALLARVCAFILLVAGLLAMLKANSAEFPMFSRAYGAACLVCGFSMMFSFKGIFGDETGPGWPHMLAGVSLCVCLVCTYRENADSITLWTFFVEIMALIAMICAHVNLASFHYDKSNPGRALLWCMLSVVFGVSSLSGENSLPVLAMFLAESGIMLLYVWILSFNMTKKEIEDDDY